ncbi:MAG: S8 family serine peptidase [Clostridiales Family XIII bacterium]|jgi:hypothetical protein|nr:S8 family serine peptidase [Clostridiales Family XIII bacterium]
MANEVIVKIDKIMKIAVIDNGVSQGDLSVPAVAVSFRLPGRGSEDAPVSATGQPSHGAVCAHIIGRINPGAEIVDLAALDGDGRAYAENLAASLEWCRENSIKLVNMSLGTINYHDWRLCMGTLKKFLDGGGVAVAAYHNGNIPSFPAAVPGVFGVRQDRGGALSDGEYGFQRCAGLDEGNCLVAHCHELISLSGEKIGTAYANSFAAPVVTGWVSKHLESGGGAGFGQVLDFLKRNASPKQAEAPGIQKLLGRESRHALDMPVIVFEAGLHGLFLGMYARFSGAGYCVEAFSDVGGGAAIPLGLYLGRGGAIGGRLLSTLEHIYKPDACMFCVYDGRMGRLEMGRTADVAVRRRGGVYEVTTEEGIAACADEGEVFSAIMGAFETE